MDRLTTRYLSLTDLYPYCGLVQYISSVEKDAQKYLEQFELLIEDQVPSKFVMIVCDNEDQSKIYLTANITYTFRISRNGTYDMIIQDMVYAQEVDTLPAGLGVDHMLKGFHCLMEEYEARHHFRVHKRVLFGNHLLEPFHGIFLKRGYHII